MQQYLSRKIRRIPALAMFCDFDVISIHTAVLRWLASVWRRWHRLFQACFYARGQALGCLEARNQRVFWVLQHPEIKCRQISRIIKKKHICLNFEILFNRNRTSTAIRLVALVLNTQKCICAIAPEPRWWELKAFPHHHHHHHGISSAPITLRT